ncbi:hypothetical protein ACIOD2_46775 [Amycolatopsis sp. NPDC088138]|uniref:hypothetical protein n=1 Tax=Amycolatopsis sp. NPDC088138 TaxID=3363938 RepID=UPI003812503E
MEHLAIHACETIADLPDIVLDTVIPTSPEPSWDISLAGTVATHRPKVRIVDSGDWRELEPGRYDLVPASSTTRSSFPGWSASPGRSSTATRATGTIWPANLPLRNGEDLAEITLHVIDQARHDQTSATELGDGHNALQPRRPAARRPNDWARTESSFLA